MSKAEPRPLTEGERTIARHRAAKFRRNAPRQQHWPTLLDEVRISYYQ